MTQEQVLERAARDPVFFGYAFFGWHAYPEQARWLRSSNRSQNWLRTGNRWGKSESIAIKHLHRCTFKKRDPKYSYDDPYNTVSCALSLDQARLSHNKAWRFIQRPQGELYRTAMVDRLVQTPFPVIIFKNGSRFQARSTQRHGTYLEGHDFDYATVDEAAFEIHLGYLIDEVLSIRLLDRGGQLDCISTGKRGSEFNRRFKMAENDGDQYRQTGTTTDNPHINRVALDRIIARLDPGLLEERIYGGERPSDGRIPYESIRRALDQGTGLKPASSGHRYSTGWDLAKSRDYTVGITLDISERPFQLVAFEKFNIHTVPEMDDSSYWKYVENRIRLRHSMYSGLLQVDATGLGVTIADHLADLGMEAVVFTGQRLIELIGCLELAFGLGLIGMPVIEQHGIDQRLWTFVNELEEVGDLLTTLDSATALALAVWGLREELQGATIGYLQNRVAGVTQI